MILFPIRRFSFQSTPSAWRETLKKLREKHGLTNFNPLPPHGGRLYGIGSRSFPACISIHSLRMEGDPAFPHRCVPTAYFNPLPPHGGRPCRPPDRVRGGNFNPLPPHGGRRILGMYADWRDVFQSTPSAWRETAATGEALGLPQEFQSTPSAWRET